MSDKLLQCKFKLIDRCWMCGYCFWSVEAEYEQRMYLLVCKDRDIDMKLCKLEVINKPVKMHCKKVSIIDIDDTMLEILKIVDIIKKGE